MKHLDADDMADIAGCTCLATRRGARALTRVYDGELKAVGLSTNQFGVLARLYGESLRGREQLPVGVLADVVGKHYTTLNRDLGPLVEEGFVLVLVGEADRRVRMARLTAKGRAKVAAAAPHWRRAQRLVEKRLGRDKARSITDLLDFTAKTLVSD